MALLASAQNDCKGQVGAYSYDLTPLAEKLGYTLLRADGGQNGMFSYSVCNDQTGCVTQYDTKATVCLWAVAPTMWFRQNARFQPLASGNDAGGFTLYIPNGYNGDRTVEDGEFSFVNATGGWPTYYLQYVSKYACPIAGPSPSPSASRSPSPSPSPSPSLSPSRENSCCLYQFKYESSDTKTLCAVECPLFFDGYWLVYNWTVSPCTSDTCFFQGPRAVQ